MRGAQIVAGMLLKWEGNCNGRAALSEFSATYALKSFPEKSLTQRT